jgi:hypothetical protein
MGEAQLELSQAARATVRDLARRSELLFCWIRIVGYGGIALRYLVHLIYPAAIRVIGMLPGRTDWFGPLMFSYAILSALLLLRLRRASPPPWFGLASALADVVTFELAVIALNHSYGDRIFELPATLAVVATAANCIAIGGALRFKRDTAIAGALGAGVIFFTAASFTRMPQSALWGVTLMTLTAGLNGFWVTRLVTSAARAAAARTVLARFLPTRVIDDAHADPSALLKPRRAEATVVISDVRGSRRGRSQRATRPARRRRQVSRRRNAGGVRRARATRRSCAKADDANAAVADDADPREARSCAPGRARSRSPCIIAP